MTKADGPEPDRWHAATYGRFAEGDLVSIRLLSPSATDTLRARATHYRTNPRLGGLRQ